MAKSILTYCNSCGGDKNHKSLFVKSITEEDRSTEDFHVVQCMGCDSVSFLRIVTAADSLDEPLHFNYPESLFCSTSVYDFLSDEQMEGLPSFIYDLYEEVVHAFRADAAILSGIGLRTLVEAVCLEQNIAGANLKEKIEGLFKEGLISNTEMPIIDKLRLIGNFSAHQIRSLSMDKLEYALGIVNHVLISIYVLPKLNKRLNL